MNLYLYIPPCSAHPEKMLRSLIFGRLRAYWLENTYLSDFYAMAVFLNRRLMACGYSFPTLKPLFEEASIRLQTQLSQRRVIHCQPTDANEKATKPIIFHLEYYPRGIQPSQVRQVYSDTLAPLLPDRNLILAVSRPRNLRHRVCSTRLQDIPGENPSDLITNIGGDRTTSPQILPMGWATGAEAPPPEP
jgi:hypothetical protein